MKLTSEAVYQYLLWSNLMIYNSLLVREALKLKEMTNLKISFVLNNNQNLFLI